MLTKVPQEAFLTVLPFRPITACCMKRFFSGMQTKSSVNLITPVISTSQFSLLPLARHRKAGGIFSATPTDGATLPSMSTKS